MKPSIAWAALVLVSAASIADIWVGGRPPLAPISDEELQTAVAELRKMTKPGDVVVHSPLLGMDELKTLGDIRASSHLPTQPTFQTRRVLLLDRRDEPMFGFPAAAQTVDVGANTRISLFEPAGGAQAIVFDLKASILASTMRIEEGSGGAVTRCDRARGEGGFSCPGQDSWLYIAERSLRVGGEDRRCVWAHPKAGAALVFAIPLQPPAAEGRALELRLHAGFADDAVTSTPDGSVSRVEIHQGERQIGRLSVSNRIGWFEHRVRIESDAALQLRVTSPRDGRRHLCLDALIVDIEPAGAP